MIITITIIIINTVPVVASDGESVGGWSDAVRYSVTGASPDNK